MTFSIDFNWLSSQHEAPEVSQTGATLRIGLDDAVLTRNVDDWSKTVSDDVRLSAYPLALWFAANWWRLRWESLASGKPSLSWRMSHELAAAGYGYVWPRVLFASDGEVIEVWSEPGENSPAAPVTYLTQTHGFVPAGDFERTVDGFVQSVLARLDKVELRGTSLHELWNELRHERDDKDLATYRRLEAVAGFDPGEGPDDILGRLEEFVPAAGAEAVQEIATLCGSGQSTQVLDDVSRLVHEPGLEATPDDAATRGQDARRVNPRLPAWVRGKEMALAVRHHLGWNGQPVSNEDLCGLLGVAPGTAMDTRHGSRAKLALAVRHDRRNLSLHLRPRTEPARRFELARFLYDHAVAVDQDRWLPVTGAKTSRQKAQRAFAAEFLCPIESLKDFLDEDYSDDMIDDAAQHFNVDVQAVRTQLVNNYLLPREFLPGMDRSSVFPYRQDAAA
ncbi:ImmA/IrrE family metallo-endopeptidase [Achromobacter pestifer]|uniref:ImmA/IrrE family metallo-endopeptidase n=1 Tax=Achromobacter pestifer TaxID=1353889 RepID=A0A6S6YY05_9BURK|nr:hypothetical protein [Achromobacter pestifer]CAB3647612.1 hypothetical protein LMG3431_02584 [Achromobacter pestifer]